MDLKEDIRGSRRGYLCIYKWISVNLKEDIHGFRSGYP